MYINIHINRVKTNKQNRKETFQVRATNKTATTEVMIKTMNSRVLAYDYFSN